MRRVTLAAGALSLLLAACGGGETVDGDDALARERPPTTAAPATPSAAGGACGLKPLTFANERWQGSGAPPPGGAGVVWEQTYTFSNPNAVDVRLSTHLVHLRLSGSGGYFLKMARSTFRPVPDETIPGGREQQRVAQVWLAEGNTPATEDLFVTSSAKVGGSDCAVPVERLSGGPAPAHVLSLPTCDPQQAATAC